MLLKLTYASYYRLFLGYYKNTERQNLVENIKTVREINISREDT